MCVDLRCLAPCPALPCAFALLEKVLEVKRFEGSSYDSRIPRVSFSNSLKKYHHDTILSGQVPGALPQ